MSDDKGENDSDLHSKLKAWAIKSGLTLAFLNDLLNILNKKDQYLLKDNKTLLPTPKTINDDQKYGGSCIYFGREIGIKACLNKLTNHFLPNDSINIDGLPLHKSTSSQCWPILGTFDDANIFIICLFYGTSKPEPIHAYLRNFIKELKTLTCFKHLGKNIRTIHHTGYSSCVRCMIKGSWNGRVVFNDHGALSQRRDVDFSKMKYDGHEKGEIQLLQIQFSCVSSFELD